MDINLVHLLQTCLDDCEHLLKEAERDKDWCNQSMSGDLLKAYTQASDVAVSRIKKIKDRLYNLQIEAKLEE